MQNLATRVVMRSSYDTNASILESLRWDNLSLRRQKFSFVLCLKCLRPIHPAIYKNFFVFLNWIQPEEFRNEAEFA